MFLVKLLKTPRNTFKLSLKISHLYGLRLLIKCSNI